VDLINTLLQREPFGLGAQLIATPDEIEVERKTAPANSQTSIERKSCKPTDSLLSVLTGKVCLSK